MRETAPVWYFFSKSYFSALSLNNPSTNYKKKKEIESTRKYTTFQRISVPDTTMCICFALLNNFVSKRYVQDVECNVRAAVSKAGTRRFLTRPPNIHFHGVPLVMYSVGHKLNHPWHPLSSDLNWKDLQCQGASEPFSVKNSVDGGVCTGRGPCEAKLATALSRYKTTSWLMVYERPLIAITAKQKNMLWSGKWMASYPWT